MSSLYAQYLYPPICAKDHLDVFWSPRHHLPNLPNTLPSVVTIHDLVWKVVPETMTRLGATAERILMPKALKQARQIIAVSHATAHDLERFFPESIPKLTVVYPASFLPAGSSNSESSENSILFVGTLEPRKNLKTLLHAFRKLLDEGTTSHRLVIAGATGWKQGKLSATISSLGLAARVDVLHEASDDLLGILYQQCDFLVLPSLYEGFGLTLVEAMSCGKPLITSNASSMPEVAGEAGLLVDPYSIEDISAAMKRMITDRKLHQALSERARLRSRTFSWERSAEQTMRVLEAAATGR